MPWNPERYLAFQREREAPFADALALVDLRPRLRVVDLGCGTGELTRRLADALPESDVLGVDTSPEMLARAARQVRPGLRFEQQSIEEATGTWDLVFSHAALQWVDDHETLVPRIFSHVAPAGSLVVQVPSNHGHDTHRLIAEVCAEEPFRSAIGGWSRRTSVLSIDRYAELLHAAGGVDLVVLEKVYPHLLAGADALAHWTSGTALVPYFERLPEALHEPFMREYRARLRERWPGAEVLYTFRRTLFRAKRPA